VPSRAIAFSMQCLYLHLALGANTAGTTTCFTMACMPDSITVVPGLGRIDLSVLSAVAGDFGWSVDVAKDLYQVASIQESRKTVAVLFSRDALAPNCSWRETISLLRLALPNTRLVPCRGFSDSIGWQELCDAGAFHSLWLPLRENEVRRSLGFVWQAQSRETGLSEKVSSVGSGRNSSDFLRRHERSQPEVAQGLRVINAHAGDVPMHVDGERDEVFGNADIHKHRQHVGVDEGQHRADVPVWKQLHHLNLSCEPDGRQSKQEAEFADSTRRVDG
jgi:hypothetical protein